MKKAHFILFEKHNLIYGRVPKVANSSIKAKLTTLLELPPTGEVKTTSDLFWKNSTNGETKMIGLKEARSLRKTHFSFAFVRNPFDRIVSAYNNKIIENTGLSKLMTEMGLTNGMPFSEFISAICNTPAEAMDPHLMPQSTMLVHESAVVPRFVGRFERMDEDWWRLQKIFRGLDSIGLKPLGKLPKKNVRREPGDDLRRYFDSPELIGKIAEKYMDDLTFFYADVPLEKLLDKDVPALPPIVRVKGLGGAADHE